VTSDDRRWYYEGMGEDGTEWDARRCRREEKVVTELNTRPRRPPARLALPERAQEISKTRRFGLGAQDSGRKAVPCRGVVCTASLAIADTSQRQLTLRVHVVPYRRDERGCYCCC
jgi:hypothetical protein